MLYPFALCSAAAYVTVFRVTAIWDWPWQAEIQLNTVKSLLTFTAMIVYSIQDISIKAITFSNIFFETI